MICKNKKYKRNILNNCEFAKNPKNKKCKSDNGDRSV